MDNREDVIRTALNQMGIPLGAEVRGVKHQDNKTDVYVNGEYFKTFDNTINQFIGTMPIKVERTQNSTYLKGKMSVSVARKDLWEDNPCYSGAEVKLPTTTALIKDVLERARVKDEPYIISCCSWNDHYFDCGFIQNTTIEELNFLAEQLSQMDTAQGVIFEGLMEMRCKNMIIKDLINITYNLDECHAVLGIKTDAELGEFYSENNFIPELDEMPKKVWEFIDYGKIGKYMRESEKSIFINGGYVVDDISKFEEPYDGITLPNSIMENEYIFTLLISKAPAGDDPTNEEGCWLKLPTTKDEMDNFLKGLGVESFDECVFYDLSSILPRINEVFVDLSQIYTLNTLAQNAEVLKGTNEMAKFKAVLEYTECDSLEKAINYANNLGCFELYTDMVTSDDYGKFILSNQAQIKPTDELFNYFDYGSYGRGQMQQNNVKETNYGLLKQTSTDMDFRYCKVKEDSTANMEM